MTAYEENDKHIKNEWIFFLQNIDFEDEITFDSLDPPFIETEPMISSCNFHFNKLECIGEQRPKKLIS